MDFFTAVRDSDKPPPPTDALDVHTFAAAIPSVPLTRLTPPLGPLDPTPSMSAQPQPTSASSFVAVLPAQVAAYLGDHATLVVDIRPPAAYADARLPRALSLSVPSTLLKRPLFSLDRLAAMLPSPAARHQFNSFREFSRILVYDADANCIPESSNIHGLLRKFRAAHFAGELSWLRGGFQTVWREHRHLIDSGPPPEAHDDEDPDDPSGPAPLAATPVLRTRHLPMSAFGLSSTVLPTAPQLRPIASNPFFDTIRQNTELSHGITERIPLRLPNRVRRRINDLPFPWLRDIASRADRMPRPQYSSSNNRVYMHTPNPNLPYSTRPPYSSASASASASSSFSDSSDSDVAPSAADVDEGSEALAMQFYRIELAEQRRLMSVMEHHSKESTFAPSVAPPHTEVLPRAKFPFSITAGVEKGAKNRYRHIWPFEHTRVRLHEADKKAGAERRQSHSVKEVDDYVNASYVQPLCTSRRYIATQGPLEATFEDFWRLTWQQNVHVILMLTQEMEGTMIKCGTYWPDTAMPEKTMGSLRVTLVKKVGLPGEVDLMHDEPIAAASTSRKTGSSSFSFGTLGGNGRPWKGNGKKRITTIKRTFKLEHLGYPAAGAREVIHLQYLEWPDMNVPEDAKGILGLVREVEMAVKETGERRGSPAERRPENGLGVEQEVDTLTGVAWHGTGGRRPVLLHCSAGVGRTGGFIAMDAALDAVRREFRTMREKRQETAERDEMEVDVEVKKHAVGQEGKRDEDVVTVPLSMSGQPSPDESHGSGNSSAGLVVHVPAVVVPSHSYEDQRAEDTPMSVDAPESQSTRQWVENVDNQYAPPQTAGSEFVATPPPPSSPISSSPFPTAQAESGATATKPSKDYSHPYPLPLAALKMKSVPTHSASSSSVSTSSLSMFPLFSDSDGGASRVRKGSKARDSSLGTSVSGGSAESDFDGREFRATTLEEDDTEKFPNQRFRTMSEPQASQTPHARKTKAQLSLGLGMVAGPSPLAKSSGNEGVDSAQALRPSVPAMQHSDHHLAPDSAPKQTFISRSSPPLTLDSSGFDKQPSQPPVLCQTTKVHYKEPRVLHGTPTTPVELSTLEEPIWEIVQDMREQRMSLCQTLRQFVFVHQVVIEGALEIADEELERERKEGRRVDGEGSKDEHSVHGDRSLPVNGNFLSSDFGGVALNRSVTLPRSFSPYPSPSTSRISLPLPTVLNIPKMPPMQSFNGANNVSGVSSESGSMKRGASPTELLKEGKKGEPLLSKRPSLKRRHAPSNKPDRGASLLDSVPPSPMRFE